jgi:hypothetical protein
MDNQETKEKGKNNNDNKETIHVQQQNTPMTYIEIVTKIDEEHRPVSVLEIDLVISREKGQEYRSLSINFAEIDSVKQELIEKSISLNEDSFYVLKQFFSQLEWNN